MTVKEIGCYGDGAFGHQHTRNRCSETIEYYVNENFRSRGLPVPACASACSPDDVIMALRNEMSDDAWEEFAAIEWLNEHAPFTDHVWCWQDGDFGLWLSEEEI